MRLHCLFEQSGTFKNEFRKLTGGEAFDYDILDDFGQTDFKVDLFSEIEKAYSGEPSIFDGIAEDDVCFAFFPCVRFQTYLWKNSLGLNPGMKNWTDVQKITYSEKLISEMAKFYSLWCRMFLVAKKKKINMVVENPKSCPHICTEFFPVKPGVIHNNRSLYGDYFRKPTQYWFVNFEPKKNDAVPPPARKPVRVAYVHKDSLPAQFRNLTRQKQKSLISPDYANYFLREYIL